VLLRVPRLKFFFALDVCLTCRRLLREYKGHGNTPDRFNRCRERTPHQISNKVPNEPYDTKELSEPIQDTEHREPPSRQRKNPTRGWKKPPSDSPWFKLRRSDDGGTNLCVLYLGARALSYVSLCVLGEEVAVIAQLNISITQSFRSRHSSVDAVTFPSLLALDLLGRKNHILISQELGSRSLSTLRCLSMVFFSVAE